MNKANQDSAIAVHLVRQQEAQQRLESSLLAVFGERVSFLTPHKWDNLGLTIGVKAADVPEVFRSLRDEGRLLFNMLIDVTCVDFMDKREPRFDVVYQLMSLTHLTRLSVKVQVSEEKPEVPSVLPLWPSANFLEREVWDMYGVVFTGHGDLRRILMYDEFVGHPLRKDYPLRGKQPRVPLRVPELRDTSADMSRDDLVALPRKTQQESERARS